MMVYEFRKLRNSAAVYGVRSELTDDEFQSLFGWPREAMKKMKDQFYTDRDQEVADIAIAKMEDYGKRSRKNQQEVGRIL